MAIGNQLYLDPRDTSTIGPVQSVYPVSKALKKFGFFPNFGKKLNAGDLLLFSPIVPRGISKRIIETQKNNHIDENAIWTHAAIYLGANEIIEAVRSGVRKALVHDYVGEHLIRARSDPAFDDAKRLALVVNAMSQIRNPYGSLQAVRMWFNSRKNPQDSGPLGAIDSEAVVCSQLYAVAYGVATGSHVVVHQGTTIVRDITPAHLSMTSRLQDVDLQWCPF